MVNISKTTTWYFINNGFDGACGVLSTLAALFGHELALQLENLKLLVPQAFEYMNQYLTQYLQTHPAVYEWLAGLEWARELRDNPQQF